MRAAELGESPVLLYDGDCGLCAASVQFVLRNERRHHLRFATLAGEIGRAVRDRHPGLEDVDSVVWVDPARGGAPERILVRADAALRVARYVGGTWRLAGVARIVPRALRDRIYDLVARHRHRLFPGAGRCLVPAPEHRARFLDDTETGDIPLFREGR